MIRSDVALSNDQIAHYVPSIFAEDVHDSRSERYLYIPTVVVNDVIEGAFEVLKLFEQIDHMSADIKHQQLHQNEQEAIPMAALA